MGLQHQVLTLLLGNLPLCRVGFGQITDGFPKSPSKLKINLCQSPLKLKKDLQKLPQKLKISSRAEDFGSSPEWWAGVGCAQQFWECLNLVFHVIAAPGFQLCSLGTFLLPCAGLGSSRSQTDIFLKISLKAEDESPKSSKAEEQLQLQPAGWWASVGCAWKTPSHSQGGPKICFKLLCFKPLF